MSSSSSVLRHPPLAGAFHLGGPAPLHPDVEAALVAARRAGYDEGFGEGRAAAAAHAAAEAARALGAIQTALADAVAAAVAGAKTAVAASAPAVVALAFDMARHLVGALPDELAAGLVERLVSALDDIDDDDVLVTLSPGDVDRVGPRLTGVDVRPDPALSPGEATITSRWASADLTLATAWSLVREAYGA